MEASVQDRISRLQNEHRTLDEKILSKVRNAQPDQIELQRLKKRKLQLKDQIAALQASLVPDISA
jgi:hypothetical protein